MQIRQALLEVLNNRTYRERAEQVGSQLRQLWDPGTAVRLLRQLAESGRPILSDTRLARRDVIEGAAED